MRIHLGPRLPPRRSLRSSGRWAVFAVLALVVTSASAQGQGTYFNQRDDQFTLLGLKRAQDAYQVAKADFDRQRSLFDTGVVSGAALDSARRTLSEAEVNYQQSILASLFEQQYVSVTSAVKLRSGHRKRVRLQLENTSGGGAEIGHLLDVDPQLYEALRPEVVHNIYVALANDDGTVVSRPYETKIQELRYGKPRTLELDLLQDLDEVTVMLTYGNGSQRSLKVFLQKDSSADRVLVESRRFSQEVELGQSAEFDLDLELFSGSSDTYKLEVLGLPQEIHRFFKDAVNGARLSQFRFAEAGETRRAALQVSLPDRPSAELALGRALPFWVAVLPRDRVEALRPQLDAVDLASAGAAEQLAGLGVGVARLELIPRGVGRLLTRAPQLYFPIQQGDPVSATVELVNEGTRRLDNVEVEVEAPLGWTKRVEPALIPSLDVGEERTVTVHLEAPPEVTVGRYEARIRSSSFADEKTITGQDKTLSVEIRGVARLGPSLILAGLMVALVLGIVIFGVRLTRR